MDQDGYKLCCEKATVANSVKLLWIKYQLNPCSCQCNGALLSWLHCKKPSFDAIASQASFLSPSPNLALQRQRNTSLHSLHEPFDYLMPVAQKLPRSSSAHEPA